MTATQAPTPGPLSGDDVNRECKACGAFKAERDAACPFCGLAPTAPVEASGSERENLKAALQRSKGWPHDLHPGPAADAAIAALHPQTSGETREHGPKCWGKTSASDEMAHCYCGSTDLRPQPSGDTREAVARIIADHVSGGFDAALQDKQEWKDRSGLGYDCEPSDVNGPFKDDYLDAADAILVLLSARPLAVGGQHSGGEGE